MSFVGSRQLRGSAQLSDLDVVLKDPAQSAVPPRRAEGGAAVQVTLVAIGSFVLLAVTGVVIFVSFRRAAKVPTDSPTSVDVSNAGGIPSEGLPTELDTLSPHHSPMSDDPYPGNLYLCSENELDTQRTFPWDGI
jgi:hypothetical protein